MQQRAWWWLALPSVVYLGLFLACGNPRESSPPAEEPVGRGEPVGQSASAFQGPLLGVSVSPSTATIAALTSLHLSAIGTFGSGTAGLAHVNWASDTPSVATVSSHGGVRAQAAGVATITATDPTTGLAGSATITVTGAVLQSIHLTSTTHSLPVGAGETIVATGNFGHGTTGALDPSSVTWQIDPAGMAFVSVDSLGNVTALAPGSATLTAISGTVSATFGITVTSAPLLSLAVAPLTATIPLGETQAFTATGTFQSGTMDLTRSVTWSVGGGSGADGGADDGGSADDSGPGVAGLSITPDGVVTPLALGTTTITATFGSLSATSQVTVVPAVVVGLTLIPSSPSFSLGTTEILVAIGSYSDGTTRQDPAVTWSSASPGVLTVDLVGRLWSVAMGTSIVTATDSTTGISAPVNVAVTAPPMPVVGLSQAMGGIPCAFLQDGRVKCWGANESGQLGTGDTMLHGLYPGEMGDNLPALDLGTGVTMLAITTGQQHACALLGGGVVKCWGDNTYGQLGQGDTMPRGNLPGQMGNQLAAVDLGTNHFARSVYAGGWHTCALLDDYSVKCWGANVDVYDGTLEHGGQLGLGDFNNRGDQPNEMGDNLPPVDLGTGRTARSVAAGIFDTCAILDTGALKCWGINGGWGQPGLCDDIDHGDRPGQMGDALPAVDLGTGRTVQAVWPGLWAICALLDDDSLKCWGREGLLGLGDYITRGDVPGTMGDNLPPVSLGTGVTPVMVSTPGWDTCVLLSNSLVKCWGDSATAGTGDSIMHGTGPDQMGDFLPFVNLGTGRTVLALVGNGQSQCALLDDGKIKCWGDPTGAYLGLGDDRLRGYFASDMGDNLPFLDLGH
jgi:alpha-tubulin suppressor-like RCC1 family protein/uncharacterized protein YjdB